MTHISTRLKDIRDMEQNEREVYGYRTGTYPFSYLYKQKTCIGKD